MSVFWKFPDVCIVIPEITEGSAAGFSLLKDRINHPEIEYMHKKEKNKNYLKCNSQRR
jgi:hypothetical protein